MDGNGILVWPDKKRYAGGYKEDNKHGYGIFIWPDGKKYEGCWLNGKQQGYGIFTNNGVSQCGEWKVGKKIRWIDMGISEYNIVMEDLRNKKLESNFIEIEPMINKNF
jgi:hypothetical protein